MEILHDPIKVYAIASGIKSKESRSYAEAIEILDGLGSEGVALGGVLERDKVTAVLGFKNTSTLLKELAKIGHYPWLNVCVFYAIGELQLHGLFAHVAAYVTHPNRMLRASSVQCLAKLKQKSKAPLKEKTKSKKKSKNKPKQSATPKKKTQKGDKNMAAIDMEKILFLRGVPIFADVDVNDLQWISEIMRERKMEKGDYVFHENDNAHSFYIVQDGEIHIRKGDITLEVLESREHFGEVAIFDQEPRTASAFAVKASLLLAIDRNDFHRLLLARPRISLSMFRTISHRLRELTKRVTS